MSDWKNAYRSFYYERAEPPDDILLDPHTAVGVGQGQYVGHLAIPP